MDLVLPEPPALQYELEAQILSQDAARVATSLRKAYSYGILRSRIRDEARMECLSAEVKAENGELSSSVSDDWRVSCLRTAKPGTTCSFGATENALCSKGRV